MKKEELEVIKNAARIDEWYKRDGIFKDSYKILTGIKIEKPKQKEAKPKTTTKKKGK